MTAQQLLADYGAYAGTFVVAFISGFVPLVTIDALLAGIALKTDANLPLVVLLATVATLASKLPTYFAVRGLVALPGKHRDRVERMRVWVGRWGKSPVLVLAASAFIGFPPFSLVASVAGAFGVRARTFSVVVFFGRLLRFSIVVAIARAYR